jgi:tetratricopeptide (TPR) repeat protein
MKFLRILAALAVAVTLADDGLAQSKGNLRLTGKVLDAAGKPVAEAQVRAAKKGEAQPQVFSAKTNDKGEYTINNLAPGEWVIEAAKETVGVKEVSAMLVEGTRTTTVDITIAKPTPKPDANAEHQRALQLAQSGKIPEARQVYEELMKVYPELHQLHAMMGNLYAAEGNTAKALEHLDIALAKEPANVDWLVLKADVMMEAKDQAGAEKILSSIDITKVKEARAFINLAINQINGGKAAEAVDLLTRLQAQFPSDASILYYRGRAYVADKKLAEAKADFEKFVATAPPGSPQLADAQKLLEQLNKK